MSYINKLNEYFISGKYYFDLDNQRILKYKGISTNTHCIGNKCPEHSKFGICTGIKIEFETSDNRCAYTKNGEDRFISMNLSNCRW